MWSEMPINIDEYTDLPEWYKKPTLILGCGNILLGDDGFGPTVASNLLKNYNIPDDTHVMDVGIGARRILFTIALGETKIKRIIIIDAVNFKNHGKIPGEIFEIPIEDIPLLKIDDFSMHQVPSSNLLKEIRDYCNMKITILACQVKKIPEHVLPGLSKPVQNSVPKMCNKVLEMIGNKCTHNGDISG
jgi:coenzyme F420 hydrogenase subunit delta